MTAHAYLLYPDAATLGRDAASRLRALADYTELGSGLRIAMRDLEIRGPGNLLGDEQSGHVAAVGFELYLEMLNDAVLEGQGRDAPEREVRVEVPVSAYIPGDYVALEAAKIDLHRRIGLAEDLDRGRGPARRAGGPLRPGAAAGRRPPAGSAAADQAPRRRRQPARAARGPRDDRAREPHQPGPARLRQAAPGATYAGRERIVSLPVGAAPSERLAAAEAALDALAGASALAA